MNMVKNSTLYHTLLGFLLCFGSFAVTAKIPTTGTSLQPAPSQTFIENKGQIADQNYQPRHDIQYALTVPGVNIFVGNGQLHYQWARKHQAALSELMNETSDESLLDVYRMDVVLLGANTAAEMIPGDIQTEHVNYYLPQCPDGARAGICNKITYKNVYPNIDWVLYTKDNHLKYDFVVRPGGNPQHIKLKYLGATSLKIDAGALVATTPFGTVTEAAPYAYDAETKQLVDAAFNLDNNIVGFTNSGYERTLVIDPLLNIATYYGGSLQDYSTSVTTDGTGYVYMTGITESLSNIASQGAFQNTLKGSLDGYVVMFSNYGKMQWATYYGGTDYDAFVSAACDKLGNVYVAGNTKSSTGIASPASYQPLYGGLPFAGVSGDGILVKFDKDGDRKWATYYGGTGIDVLNGVTVFKDTCIYVAGSTNSFTGIATSGSYKPNLTDNAFAGIEDAFLVRFDSAGNRVWGTYFGGPGNDAANSLVTDYAGNIYIGGTTRSISEISTTGSHQEVDGSLADTGTDAYLAKFNPQGTNVIWSTYYGGTGSEDGTAVAYDPFGYIYLGGNTISANNIATPNAHKPNILGVGYDGFAVKFDLNGQRQWGTYYGGPDDDRIAGLAVSSVNQLYVYGTTNSQTGISTTNGYQTTFHTGTGHDMFFARFSMSGLRQMGSYFGGTGVEDIGGPAEISSRGGTAIHCANGYIYFVGNTRSSSGISGNNPNYWCHQPMHNGVNATGNWYDGFLAVFEDDPPKPIEILQPFNDTVLCPGDKLVVNYDLSPPPFQFPNSFEVWLSDALGSFANEVRIGTKQTSQAGSITCMIPDSTKPGSKYRVHIRSTNPFFSSDNNGIDIRIKPSPGAVNISSNGPVCEGDSLWLFANNFNPGTSFEWTGPNSFSSADRDPSVALPTIKNTGKYTITATLDGCKTHDTDSVVIMPAPKLKSIGSNSPVCEGYTLFLYTTDSASGVTYTWTGPDNFKSSQKTPQINSSNLNSQGMYTLVANIGSCVKKASTYITVKKHPGLVDVTANSPVCEGEDLEFQVEDTLSGSKYSWEGPSGFKSTTKAATINKAKVVATGSYILTAEHDGCFAKDTVTVTVKPVPVITVNSDKYVMAGDTIFLSVKSDLAAQFSWSGPNFFTSSEPYPYVYPANYMAEGVYEVAAEYDGCFAGASVLITVKLPDEDIFVLFPNPNKGNFAIKGDVRSDTRINLEVIDAIGRIVYKDRVDPKNNKVNASISLPGYLSNGVYHLILRTGLSKKSISFTIDK